MSTTAEDSVEEQEEVVTDPIREAIAQAFADHLGEGFIEQHIVPGRDLTIRVASTSWVAAAQFARDKLAMTWLDFISAIDWMISPFGRDMDAEQDQSDATESADSEPIVTGVAGGDTRFQAFMRLYSIDERIGCTIKADLADDALSIETLIPTFAGASWHEREMSEMFGIHVANHPDLRALYLPTNFEGNPLRKDYPLVARRVKPWPGIVDVEAMPGDDDGDDSDAEATPDGEAAE